MCKLVHGEPPTPKHHAAHNCGNGHNGCLNPNHLRWATCKENMDDKVQHHTDQRGQRHWNAKLTDKDVHRIRFLKGKMSVRRIGAEYGVNYTNILAIYAGRTWAWLKDAETSGARKDNILTAYSWRKLIFERDGFACQRCGDIQGDKLRAHHIDGYLQNPGDRANPDNGITLCEGCHRGFHAKYGNTNFGREQLNEYLAAQG